MEREDILREIQVLKSLLVTANRFAVTKLADAVVLRLTFLVDQLK